MALSIWVFVADSADAQLAYLRVVLLLLLLGLPLLPHDSRKAAILLNDTPTASERKIKSRRLILPASRSCSSWFMSLIDITPICERTMKDNHRKTVRSCNRCAILLLSLLEYSRWPSFCQHLI